MGLIILEGRGASKTTSYKTIINDYIKSNILLIEKIRNYEITLGLCSSIILLQGERNARKQR